ncbi:MAG: cysteine hydrolase [Anaerolineae bacterium]|nr:cysteine hydrolase [Anaerolineae bacterium]
MTGETALLLIDAQVNMFEEECSVFDGERLLKALVSLIVRAHAACIPVIYVQNNGGEGDPDMPGLPGWQIHSALSPRFDELVIQKRTPDAFHETNLQSALESRQIRRLIIAGMQTEMCIDATCRRAHMLGYDVTLVKDAHSTFDDGDLMASQTIDQYNEALRAVIRVENASDIQF